jgi:hypothetical protein
MTVSDSKPKQEYHPPRLHTYGDLTQLTRSSGNMATSDGGTGKAHKTA